MLQEKRPGAMKLPRRLKFGGLGRNRTTDTRIFKPSNGDAFAAKMKPRKRRDSR
jgi:hypothetical protein